MAELEYRACRKLLASKFRLAGEREPIGDDGQLMSGASGGSGALARPMA